MKRAGMLMCLFAVIFAAASLFAPPPGPLSPLTACCEPGPILEIVNSGLLVDADDAAIHDPYFSPGISAQRALNQKRVQQYFNIRLLFAAVPPAADAEAPENPPAFPVRARSCFSFSEIVLSAVLPARAGPLCA